MTTVPSKKELTHERIVRTASQAIRRCGYDGVSVADIMKEAGLTHGGFYAHFASRDALLAEAAMQAGVESVANLQIVADTARARGQDPLAAVIDAYLSRPHVAALELGCPIAALGSEMHRQAPEVRAAATAHIKQMGALLQDLLPAGAPKGEGLALAGALIGNLLLARAVDEPKAASQVLGAARAFLQARLGTDRT